MRPASRTMWQDLGDWRFHAARKLDCKSFIAPNAHAKTIKPIVMELMLHPSKLPTMRPKVFGVNRHRR